MGLIVNRHAESVAFDDPAALRAFGHIKFAALVACLLGDKVSSFRQCLLFTPRSIETVLMLLHALMEAGHDGTLNPIQPELEYFRMRLLKLFDCPVPALVDNHSFNNLFITIHVFQTCVALVSPFNVSV
jgi:hypothetical protein